MQKNKLQFSSMLSCITVVLKLIWFFIPVRILSNESNQIDLLYDHQLDNCLIFFVSYRIVFIRRMLMSRREISPKNSFHLSYTTQESADSQN